MKNYLHTFDTDKLVDAEEFIDTHLYHKVQSSIDYTVEEKEDILSAWEKVKFELWEDV